MTGKINNLQPIYVVDDSADQRLLVGYFLKRISPDRHIALFETAQALLDSLTVASATGAMLPWIVILDLQMPGMDGYEALEIIKSGHNEKWKEIPVVILSSYVDQDLIKKCLDVGALAFLNKPVDYCQLAKLLTGTDFLTA